MKKRYLNYHRLLLIDSSEIELNKCRRVIDMFGIAKRIQTETNGMSALYYLKHANPLPELVVAAIDKDVELFVLEYEKLPLPLKMKSPLVLLYSSESTEDDRWRNYPQLKKPLCVPELCELKDWSQRTLN
jgi:hypothetical protein